MGKIIEIMGAKGQHGTAEAAIMWFRGGCDNSNQYLVCVRDDSPPVLSDTSSWIFVGDLEFWDWIAFMTDGSHVNEGHTFAEVSLMAMGPKVWAYYVDTEQMHAVYDHNVSYWTDNPSGVLLSADAIDALHDAAIKVSPHKIGPTWLRMDLDAFPHWIMRSDNLVAPVVENRIPDPWRGMWNDLQSPCVQQEFWKTV